MKQTRWVGPNGVAVTIRNGSSKPPRWALLLIDRVYAREGKAWLNLRWVRCARGCAHGRAYERLVALHVSGEQTSDRPLILHELAHTLNGHRDRHGPHFYRTLYRIALAEGRVREVGAFQRNKAAWRRARQALARGVPAA